MTILRRLGMAESVPVRLRKLLQRSGLRSLQALATAADYKGASSIQRYFNEDDYGDGDTLSLEAARKFAKALVGKGAPPITEAEVMALAGVIATPRLPSTSRLHSPSVVVSRNLAPDVRVSMRQVPVVGYVQAGVWLATIELPPEDRFDIPLPIQSGFDGFVVQGLIVRGASMDLLYPHGSVLAVVKFLDLGRDPRHGERVVILRHKHGETEATVKEFRVGSDGVERLWPRSTHPDFQQPIPVKAPADDDEELQIAYLVIGCYRPEV